MNNKPTILLGAGAVADFGQDIVPSTSSITKKITKKGKYLNYLTSQNSENTTYFTVIEKICELLKKKYPKEPNFEHIFHVLEMLEAYKWPWFHSCKNPDMFPIFAPFVVPELNVVSNNEWDGLSSLIAQCQNDIIKMVRNYDQLYNEKMDSDFQWYKQFWNKFNVFDLFNLNYDTTVEQSLSSYCDGFVDSDDNRFQRFDPLTLNTDLSCYKVCHLHGCILFDRHNYKDINHDIFSYKFNDMYKWKDYEVVSKMRERAIGSNSSNQSGEMLYAGPIITGLRKTDKITVAPYNYYFHYLNTAIMKNRALLIVGYSFGDLYINDLLERMNQLHGANKRIVIITFWKCKRNSNDKEWVDFYGKEWLSRNFDSKEVSFIAKMSGMNDLNDFPLDDTIQNEDPYIISRDGQVMLLVHGFKSAVKKHSEKIMAFLDS